MMRKTGLVLLSALHGALTWGAAGGGMPEVLPKFSEPLTLVLARLVNPQQEMLGGGGTHNSIHYSCSYMENGCVEFTHNFLDSSAETSREMEIGVHIPDGKTKSSSMRFSVGKRRFDLVHELGARHVVWREFERCSADKIKEYKLIPIEGLQDPAYGEHRVAVSIAHTALVKCWSINAGVGNTFKLTSPVQSRVVHTPPERMHHAHGCPCADCVGQMPHAPMYPVPSCPPAVPFKSPSQLSNLFTR